MSIPDAETAAVPNAGADAPNAGADALERELYWAERRDEPDDLQAVPSAEAWSALTERLREQERAGFAHSTLSTGSWPRRLLKRTLFRLFQPVSRRSGEVETEIAELGTLTAKRLEDRLTSLEWTVGPLLAEIGELRARLATQPGRGIALPDEFYWRFETFMRGDPATVTANLRQYESRAREHLTGGNWLEAPLWLDLGCGRGEFARLLQEWGWRVRGVDISAEAVDACEAMGIDAVQADALTYLRGYTDEPPAAISGLQVIEHLPREIWLELFRAAYETLQTDGALLLETINPLNVRALAGSFFADLSHAWPAHPHTLRLMAETVGFTNAELLWLNTDHQGEPQDYALWAVR